MTTIKPTPAGDLQRSWRRKPTSGCIGGSTDPEMGALLSVKALHVAVLVSRSCNTSMNASHYPHGNESGVCTQAWKRESGVVVSHCRTSSAASSALLRAQARSKGVLVYRPNDVDPEVFAHQCVCKLIAISRFNP